MAKIVTQTIVLKLNIIAKNTDSDKIELLSEEQKITIQEAIQSLVGENVIVELGDK